MVLLVPQNFIPLKLITHIVATYVNIVNVASWLHLVLLYLIQRPRYEWYDPVYSFPVQFIASSTPSPSNRPKQPATAEEKVNNAKTANHKRQVTLDNFVMMKENIDTIIPATL